MVDQIYQRNGEDVSLELSMIMGLGIDNGTRVTHQVVEKNPNWTTETTRFEIWSDIVDMAYDKKLFVHPDLHVVGILCSSDSSYPGLLQNQVAVIELEGAGQSNVVL